MKIEEIQQIKGTARERLQSIAAMDPDFGIEGPALGVEARAREARRTAEDSGEHAQSPRWYSLGVGTTQKRDDYRLAIRIRTAKRVEGLEERIAERLGDLGDLDVQYTGPVLAIPRRAAAPNANGGLKIGASISNFLSFGGTLGFFAKSRVNEEKGIVSANHVIGRQDLAWPGEKVMHPATGAFGSKRVAQFVRSAKLGGGGEKFVDGAFARLLTNQFDPSALPNGQKLQPDPAILGESDDVRKIGFKTGETHGHVTSFNHDDFEVINYRRKLGIVAFEDQIEIESATPGIGFSDGGDSGALVYNDRLRAVGLLFAQTLQGGAFNLGFSYANPIDVVLNELNVDLLT